MNVNWDAAMDIKAQRVGVGVMIRGCSGDLMACLCSSTKLLPRLAIAEAFALRRAIFFYVLS